MQYTYYKLWSHAGRKGYAGHAGDVGYAGHARQAYTLVNLCWESDTSFRPVK
jgi:hypothetical protein